MDTTRHKPLVLLVDDNETNLDLLIEVLNDEYELSVAMSGKKALDLAIQSPPDLILLDIMMPEMDGYEVCRRLKADNRTVRIPVIFVTAMSDVSDETKGFAVGAVDYITKPISPSVVLARVQTHLALADQQLACEKTVERQVNEILQAQQEAVFMLGQAGHYHDDDTGVHIWRMANYARRLAKGAGWPVEQQEMLLLAAPMHDTGKIGVPNTILQKPGKLDDEEWATMRKHTTFGHQILSVGTTPLFKLASSIALYHHERWDGDGYPAGLKGEDIPEAARIAAIADVFDALTSQRPYKKAWSADQALEYIANSNGHFEPRLAELFCSLKAELLQIMADWTRKEV